MTTTRTLSLMILLAAVLLPQRAEAQAATPYTLQNVVLLLEGRHPTASILALVEPACISFVVNEAAETALRRAGADDALVGGLRSVCYRAPARQPAAAAQPAPRGYVYIVGELPPGWSRHVNELPANTNRTIDLTPGRPAIIVLSAPGWCPDRLEVTLAANEQREWTPVLRGRPWVGAC